MLNGPSPQHSSSSSSENLTNDLVILNDLKSVALGKVSCGSGILVYAIWII